MSTKQNDIIVDDVIDFVAKMMDLNPTIPEQARHQLELEELHRRMEETILEEGYEHYEWNR